MRPYVSIGVLTSLGGFFPCSDGSAQPPYSEKPFNQATIETPLTLRVLGTGSTGIGPQPGVRVLRHEIENGTILEDRVTGSNGVADFGVVGTPRSTISVVWPPTNNLDRGTIVTLVQVRVGSLTLLGPRVSRRRAQFDTRLTGVPRGAGLTSAQLGNPTRYYDRNQGDFLSEGEWNVSALDVVYLHPDETFSIVTQAGIPGGPILSYGVSVDLDPETIGRTVYVDTSMVPSQIPFEATKPVYHSHTLVQRKGLVINLGAEFMTWPEPVTSGSVPFYSIPAAERYAYVFETDQSPTQIKRTMEVVFAVLPTSINVHMPDLNITDLRRDASKRTVSWKPSGSDVAIMDYASVTCDWSDPDSPWSNWTLMAAPDTTVLSLPQLPEDLAVVEPPGTSSDVHVSVLLGGLDRVRGFDELIASISAHNGSFDAVVFASSTYAHATTSRSK